LSNIITRTEERRLHLHFYRERVSLLNLTERMDFVTPQSSIPEEVDIIIAGGTLHIPFAELKHSGGAAGCVIAGRLASVNPSLQVLIVEAGSDNRDVPDVIVPAFMANHFGRVKNTVKIHMERPRRESGGPKFSAAVCGGTLGGGSSVNYMMYTRGSASDFDDWNMEGWRFEDLRPLFCKVYLGSGKKY
jgi:alcohol oxidase